MISKYSTGDVEKPETVPIPPSVATTVPQSLIISLPPRMLRRGRPKGQGLTVIGLPVKRGRLRRPTAFHLQSGELKIRTMLGWFVSCDIATKASRLGCDGKVINVAELERESDRVHVKYTDVNLSVIRVYFSCDDWQAVHDLVNIVRCNSVWLCFACKWALDTSAIIGCDACLEWSHMKFVQVKKKPATFLVLSFVQTFLHSGKGCELSGLWEKRNIPSIHCDNIIQCNKTYLLDHGINKKGPLSQRSMNG